MKKIIFIFILLFIFIIETNALSKFYLGEKVPNMHIESVTHNDIHNGIPFILRRDDGQFVYCLNPFEKLNTVDYHYSYNYNDKIFNITDEQLNKMNLIAYYGYNYYNHTDIKWYGITQFLIWKVLDLNDIYFTDTKDGNRIIAYEKELKEVEDLVNNHLTLPSFSYNNYQYSSNKEYKIIDENEVLYNYEILETNIDVTMHNNEIIINTKEDGIYEIKFIRKSPIQNEYLLYDVEGWQPLIYPGKFSDIVFNITIEVNSGDVTINKFDSEGKDRVDATLSGAVYGIYDKNELITTITTNEFGMTYLDDLPLGEYYVKELEPSKGYELDTNTYYFKITKENKNAIINSYENIIKGNLIINKYYGEENNYRLEDKALFELYDTNNQKIGMYQTNEGIIDIELSYGDYYLLQIEGIDGYKFIDKFNISIKENKDYVFDLYNEKELIVVEVPDTLKNNYNKHISLSLIIFGLILICISKIKNKYEKTTGCQ